VTTTDGQGHRLEFGILGPLLIGDGERPLELRRDKERGLLAMLLLRVNDVVTLDHLAGGLWEQVDAPRRTSTLRVHVSRLRQALAAMGPAGHDLVVTTARGYALEVPPDSVDARRFEQLASEGRQQLEDDPAAAADAFAQALALWRGPVLADVTLSLVDEPDIARLEEARAAVVEDRVDADLRCGRHRELLAELEQLVAEHPLRERLWGQLMVALYRSDRQADALRTYQDLRHLLGEELGISPTPSLQELERAILEQNPILAPPPPVGRDRGPRSDGAPTPTRPREGGRALDVRLSRRLVPDGLAPFFGRRAQFDALRDAWTAGAAGDRRIVLVSGEAGVGKTRLAAEVARLADETGGIVLFGRCDEDVGAPYQPFAEALEQVIRAGPTADDLGRHAEELARLVPDLALRVEGLQSPLQSDPDTELYRLFDAVVGWLAALSADRGVMLVLDDLHWAGKPSLLLLRHLARSAEPMRLLVVGTYRDSDIEVGHPLADVVADLRRDPCVERLTLPGLAADEVEEMVASAGRAAVDRGLRGLARALWSETGGNPFFVQEIVRSLVESDRLLVTDGVASSPEDLVQRAVPEGVREVIGRRLTRLSPAANQILAIASVMGEDIEFDVLVAVAGLDEETVLDALDEAVAAVLLRETAAGGYEFAHAIVRSTLYEQLSGPRRARRHRQVGEAIESLGSADAAALAHHFRLAGGADVRVVGYSAQAGEQAVAQLAFDRAVDFYSQAVEAATTIGVAPDRRCELLIRLGTAQRLAGVPTFRETLLGAAALAEEIGDASLLARAVLANNRGFASAAGTVDLDRVRTIDAAIDATGPGDSVVRARLLALRALEIMWDDPELRRLDLADDAVAIAARLGDDSCLLDSSMAAQVACSVPDRVPTLVRQLPRLVELAERAGDAQVLARVCLAGASHYLEMGDLGEANRLIARVGRLAAELENPVFGWMVAHQRCRSLTMTGTGDQIEQAALEALRIGEDGGQPDLPVWFAPQLFVARWSQGRLRETVELIRGALDATPGLAAWRATLALALVAGDEPEEAAAVVDALMVDPARAFPLDIVWLAAHSVLAEAVATVGTADQAADEYEVLAPYAGRVPCLFNVARPGVDLWLGALAARAGRLEDAGRHLASAHQQHQQLGAPVWVARTELEWGRTLLADGDAARARELLASAHAGAERLGAADVAAGAAELLDPAE
jgi:DNA-binding SARP family transcriptional activator